MMANAIPSQILVMVEVITLLIECINEGGDILGGWLNITIDFQPYVCV